MMKNLSKKIAFISEHASPLASLGGVDSGGQNVYVDRLARQLTRYGYEVDVFTRKDNAALPDVVELYPGVRVVHIKAGPEEQVRKEDLLPLMEGFTQNMIAFIEENEVKYELIHAHFFMSALVAADIKKALDIPFVVTFHALGKVRRIHQKEADKFPDSRFDIEERIMQEADRLIAECPQDFEDFIKFYDAPEDKIATIPCGVDLQDFYPIDRRVARMVLGWDQNEKVILQLGRMVKRKGIANVVKALAILSEKSDFPVRVVIVGGESDAPDPDITPEIGRLQELAERLGVADKVTFAGRKNRDQLKFYYNAADVFVSTPWYEPFGMTPLESMACGTPVIGSRVGGIKFSVADGETGFLVPPQNPEALADELYALLTNEALNDELRENAIERIKSEFTWDSIAGQMTRLYNQVTSSILEGADNSQDLQLVEKNFHRLAEATRKTERMLSTEVLEASKMIVQCLMAKGKVLACGNGGSAADAQHFVGELVGHFMMDERPGLSAIALTADTSVITALGNDFGYGQIFARQVEALAESGDVLVGISTSGDSENVIEAFKEARKKEVTCIGILGKGGGELKELSDVALVVPSSSTQIVQEMHIHLIHTVCELVEQQLFIKNKVALPE
ncbi:MAG TPA: glycosyltransferase [Balneolaceae bacterium]|nr:glycosyltransferase [Balneolaceae bacterium]